MSLYAIVYFLTNRYSPLYLVIKWINKEISKYCNGFGQCFARQQLCKLKHATTEEAAFSVDPTVVPIDWLDSDHMICVYCRSVSILGLYK
jgi:hypothetical protein